MADSSFSDGRDGGGYLGRWGVWFEAPRFPCFAVCRRSVVVESELSIVVESGTASETRSPIVCFQPRRCVRFPDGRPANSSG